MASFGSIKFHWSLSLFVFMMGQLVLKNVLCSTAKSKKWSLPLPTLLICFLLALSKSAVEKGKLKTKMLCCCSTWEYYNLTFSSSGLCHTFRTLHKCWESGPMERWVCVCGETQSSLLCLLLCHVSPSNFCGRESEAKYHVLCGESRVLLLPCISRWWCGVRSSSSPPRPFLSILMLKVRMVDGTM